VRQRSIGHITVGFTARFEASKTSHSWKVKTIEK
jgi:hypothetical protein